MNHLFTALLLLLAVTSCLSKRESRVTRGSEARPHEFKSIVHMQIDMNGRPTRWCGGILLNSRTVLSAAHCEYNGGPMRVYLGLHRVSQLSATRGVQMANVRRQIPHRGYRGVSYDIMVVKLDRDINESPTVEYGRLPPVQDQFPPARTDCTLAGWGMTAPKTAGSDVLRKGPMTALRNSPAGDRSIIYAQPGGRSRTSACKGDSGGPLYCPANDGGKPFVVGTVSGGDGYFCGSAGAPARFARVSHVVNWIRSLM